MKTFNGRVAAITGAGSGIGRALAVALADEGADLALSDVDEAGLAATARQCRGAGDVTTTIVDVADREAVERWADDVVAAHGVVHLIINNAGVALSADVATMNPADFRWLVDINLWGVVHGTQAFLPHLEASGDGHVVNISSVFGLMAIPSQSAYNASKFAVRGFTDALRMELEIASSCVSATTVHPGGVRTSIVRNGRFGGPDEARHAAAEFERVARTAPDRAAAQILRGVRRNRRRVLVGPDAPVFDLVSRLPAGLVQRLMVAAAQRAARASTPSQAELG